MKNAETTKISSVFELHKIEYGNFPRFARRRPKYPSFRVRHDRMGIYSTLAEAEQGIKEYIELYKKVDEEHGNSENSVLKDIFGFLIDEFEINKHSYFWEKSRRNYLPDGSLLDECLTSSMLLPDDDLEEFLGRPAEKVRYQNGDLVEEFMGDTVRLAIIGNPPSSPENVEKRRPKWSGGFHLDFSDDCYYALGVDGCHSHPAPVRLFPVRFPVSDKMKSELEVHYKEYRSYFDK